jgi:hypothetical protein
MTHLQTLHALKAERIALAQKLAPLNALLTGRQQDLAKIYAATATAEASLDATTEHAAHIEGLHAIGEATAAQLKAARMARQDAQAAHHAAQSAAARVRGLLGETTGLQAAGHSLGVRLMAIDPEERIASEGYLRDLADEAAGVYASKARELAGALASVLAYQQALAAADGVNPDLITPGVWHFSVPCLNSPSARTPSGAALVEIEHARLQQPAALASIRARIAADGVAIPGLT